MSRFTPEMERRARDTVAVYPRRRSAIVPLLHLGQEQNGYLTNDVMEHIAELTGVTPAQVLSVASFYEMFHFKPVGRYLLGICTNIACMLDGAEDLLHHAEERLGIKAGQTTDDGLFTIEEVECVARCNNAPCLQVNYRNFDRTTPDRFDRVIEELARGELENDVPPHGTLIRVRRSVPLQVDPAEVYEQRKAGLAAIEERAARKAAGDEEARKAEGEKAAAAAKDIKSADAERAAAQKPADDGAKTTAGPKPEDQKANEARVAERAADAPAEEQPAEAPGAGKKNDDAGEKAGDKAGEQPEDTPADHRHASEKPAGDKPAGDKPQADGSGGHRTETTDPGKGE